MKYLTLLRHAKSGWDDPVERDFDRPLNPRGRRAAQTVAREMRAQGLAFDAVLASPARRVVETLEEVAGAFGPLEPRYQPSLYLAPVETLLDAVRRSPDSAASLLLVGHNPGLEMLALALTRPDPANHRGELEIKFPTSTLVEIALPADRWEDVRERSGEIRRFIRPRDLDPALGPDPEER